MPSIWIRALFVLAMTARASAQTVPTIGLYADPGGMDCNVVTALNTPVTAYVVLLPRISPAELTEARIRVQLESSSVIVSDVVPTPLATLAIGNPFTSPPPGATLRATRRTATVPRRAGIADASRPGRLVRAAVWGHGVGGGHGTRAQLGIRERLLDLLDVAVWLSHPVVRRLCRPSGHHAVLLVEGEGAIPMTWNGAKPPPSTAIAPRARGLPSKKPVQVRHTGLRRRG